MSSKKWRAVLDRVPGRVRVLETGDPGVPADLDTAEDLARLEAEGVCP